MFRVKLLSVIFLAVLSLSAVPRVWAQGATTGQISGVVTDPNGARVPNATVKLTSNDNAQERQTVTGGDGDYAFTLLPPGRYKLAATANGFQTANLEAVVNITQTTSADIVLSVSGSNVNVVVEVAAPLVQAETSQNGRVVEETTLRQLPLPTRNFQQLLTLSPGAASGVANNTELGRGDSIITVNGQRTTSNSVRINGVDANSIGTNSTPNIAVPATESLQEFIVQTSLYDASSGRNAGGNVEAVTKSGANDFHGNVYEFFRNNRLNANDFFLNSAGRPRPVLQRNQFGGTLGGRIVENKVFFFGSYQGTRERNGASLRNSLTFPIIPVGLTDNNRTAAGLAATFGVAAASISPVSVALLNARLPGGGFVIPSASTFSTFGLTPQSGISRFREDQVNANVDYLQSSKHTLSFKNFYASNPTFQANYNFAGLGNGNNQLIGTGGDLDIIQTLLSATDTYVFSPNVVNQARFGFSRLRVTSVPQEPFTAQQLGITNPNGNLFAGAPTISVTGAFTFGPATLADQSSRINGFGFSDTLSLTHGAHRVRVGGEYRYSQVNFYFNAFSRGQVIFNPGTGISAFQNFLVGNGVSIIGSGVFDRAYRVHDLSGFVQDDWKFNNRLTLNLGVRYDFYGLPRDIRGRLVNFLPEQFRTGTAASPAGPPNGFVQAGNGNLAGVPKVEDTLVATDKNNFAPRIGFAYQISQARNIVVRGGYGIYYDRISTRYANSQIFNFPYLALGVGLVNAAPLAIFRPFSNPFIPLPAPSAFPVGVTIPSPLTSLSPVGVPISGIFVSPDLATPYVQQYNFGVQWEIAKNYLLDVGYVGNKGTKLLQVLTLNQPVYNRTANSFAAPFANLSAQKNATGGIQQVQTSSNSTYNSLQISLTKRFTNGLQFLAAYTRGNSTDYYSGTEINELATLAGDQQDWRTNRGPSDFNRKHRLVYSFVYDFPKISAPTQLQRALLNDWQIAGIFVAQSGLPFSIVDAPNNNIIQRANIAPGFSGNIATSGSTQSRLNGYFNTAAFVTSRPRVDGTSVGVVNNATFDPNAPFGNTGRNAFFGPGQKNFDLSVIKFLPLSERYKVELRAEMFNLFNWANFANPNNNIAIPTTFGRITSASAGPRVLQFAAKFNF